MLAHSKLRLQHPWTTLKSTHKLRALPKPKPRVSHFSCSHKPSTDDKSHVTSTSTKTTIETQQPTNKTYLLPFISEVDAHRVHTAIKPVGLVVASAHILAWTVELSSTAADRGAGWLPIFAGSLVGIVYAILNHLTITHVWKYPDAPLNVVVTGSTRGIGKALAREFLKANDRVIVTSRTQHSAEEAAQKLRQEVGNPSVWVQGVACDVGDQKSLDALVSEATSSMGSIDCWINNAGYSGSYKSLMDSSPETLEQIVRTNMLGTLLATRTAMQVMSVQPKGGHIFNFEGAGSDGRMATPNYAAYGATKAGIKQLYTTLQSETAVVAPSSSPIYVHNLSPGMVLTDLLLEGATLENKQAFNILCDYPETVAAFLVPRARSVIARSYSGSIKGATIRYLTPRRILLKMLAAPFRMYRYFDKEGNAVFPPEEARILGQNRKKVERLAARAARRSGDLALAYSLSIAAAYLILMVDTAAKASGSQ